MLGAAHSVAETGGSPRSRADHAADPPGAEGGVGVGAAAPGSRGGAGAVMFIHRAPSERAAFSPEQVHLMSEQTRGPGGHEPDPSTPRTPPLARDQELNDPAVSALGDGPSAPLRRRQPPGLSLLFATEMWERFSYYGMRALLFLFMTRTLDEGGLEMSTAQAGAIYGTYTSLAYLAPVIGGYVADKLLGTHRSMVIGGLVIAVGHFCLAVAGMGWFYAGLTLIILGTGFFKPCVSTMWTRCSSGRWNREPRLRGNIGAHKPRGGPVRSVRPVRGDPRADVLDASHRGGDRRMGVAISRSRKPPIETLFEPGLAIGQRVKPGQSRVQVGVVIHPLVVKAGGFAWYGLSDRVPIDQDWSAWATELFVEFPRVGFVGA